MRSDDPKHQVGTVKVNVYRGGSLDSEIEHELTAAPNFGDWINYVDNWVKGVGFEFIQLPTDPPGLAGGMASIQSTELHPLTRACLIPLFNSITVSKDWSRLLLGFSTGRRVDYMTTSRSRR
jgi:hypothetical protein